MPEAEPARKDAADRTSTIPHLIRRAAATFGNADYIVTPSQRLTFEEAELQSAALADLLLRGGVGKGTRVAMIFPQGPEFVVVLLAITRIGAVAVPLSTFLQPPELRYALRHADAHLLLAPHVILDRSAEDMLEVALPELATTVATRLRLHDAPFLRGIWIVGETSRGWSRPVPRRDTHPKWQNDPALLRAIESEVAASDLMVIISTSGTTAEPKAVVHTQKALIELSRKLVDLYELGPSDRAFTSMPFFWVGGLTVSLLSHLHVGATVMTVERLDGRVVLDLLEALRPTRVVGWGLLDRLREDSRVTGRDLDWLSELEVPLRTDVVRHGSLGMSETGGPHSGATAGANRSPLSEDVRGSFGPPIDGMEHRIVDPRSGREVRDGDEGEIWVRGDHLMDGLYKRSRSDIFEPDGWYRTGDHGWVRDGLLFFTGRRSAMIKTSGANVAVAEVERAVESLPGIRAAFVTGISDPARGEIVGCVVCPTDGHLLEPEQITQQLANVLSRYKIPRRIVVVPYHEAPLLTSGKVDRRRVVELLSRP